MIGPLHRHVWLRLPRHLRRTALFRATRLLAPRPSDVPPRLPLIVAGNFTTSSGLGASARLCYEALDAGGVSVLGIDLARSLNQPADLAEVRFRDARGMAGPGTAILHVNSPLMALAALSLGRRFLAEKYVVGYWAWELPEVPDEWRLGVSLVHEIWVPSAFCAAAMARIAGGRPVRVVPHPVAVRDRAHAPRSASPGGASRPFTFLTIFNMASGFSRKNPLATIAAFRRAFGNASDVRLIVKTSNPHAYPRGMQEIQAAIADAANVELLHQTFADAAIDALYDRSDVLVSLHRSEGFGLTLAEAMLHGVPVIATNWSGNVDFLNTSNGCPIGFDLVPARDEQGTYDQPGMSWAEARIDEAAGAMLQLRGDPDFALSLGRKARADAVSAWNEKDFCARVSRDLGLAIR